MTIGHLGPLHIAQFLRISNFKLEFLSPMPHYCTTVCPTIAPQFAPLLHHSLPHYCSVKAREASGLYCDIRNIN